MRPCAIGRHLVGLVAAVLVALAGPAAAEGPNDRYWIQLEGFRPAIESTARFDFPNRPILGTEVNFEDELGLTDRKTLPYLLMGLRLGERWRLEFEYYELNRTGTSTIQRDVRWGDLVFPASSEVSSRFDSDIYRLSAGYSFYRSPIAEIGGAFGFHVTDFALALSSQGSGPQGRTFQSEQTDERVPLPTLGLYGTYMLSPMDASRTCRLSVARLREIRRVPPESDGLGDLALLQKLRCRVRVSLCRLRTECRQGPFPRRGQLQVSRADDLSRSRAVTTE